MYHLSPEHTPDFKGVIFRRETPQITNAGGLWDESLKIYTKFGGIPKQSPPLGWTFKGGASINFSHIQHEKDVHNWQGAQITFIGFDELTHFTETQFWYMLSRNRSTCGISPYMRATCNPDPDSFVAKLIEWWIGEDGFPIQERSGIKRYFIRIANEIIWGDSKEEVYKKTGQEPQLIKSLTFVPAKLSDNKILEQKDPRYRANLMAQDEIERARLLYGNWKIKRQGKLLKSPIFGWDERPDPIGFVDTAFGGKNNTAFCIGFEFDGWYYVKGWSWRKSVVDLYDTIANLAKEHHVGSIEFESNADKGASAREFRKYWPSVTEYHERENKHNRIMNLAYYNWHKIKIDPSVQISDAGKTWLSNLLAYEEGVEPDDEADSLAGLMRRVLKKKSKVMFNLGEIGTA